MPVPDETALKFASAFYAALDQNVDVAKAVWSARKELGPAGWMYWHFGPTSSEVAQQASSPVVKKSRNSKKLLLILALLFAAVIPWMKPMDTIPPSIPEPTIVTERPAPALPQREEQPITNSTGPAPVQAGEAESLEPQASNNENATSTAEASKPSAPALVSLVEPAPMAVSLANIELQESEPDVSVAMKQALPSTTLASADLEKPGLFDHALVETDRQQSFVEAAIQTLEGYPERYLKAALKGKPDYSPTTGKASVIVEVAIDNAEYRAMALRLSETLKNHGHDGEQISAIMERPYDSYMEVRFRFSGRKQFRDLLLLCIRSNDALTQSEWEFHSLSRGSIDAILSSMSMPLLSVELTDRSGQAIASASQKIARPFLATEERGFSILPAFNGERSEMTMTSVIPGRNRLELKVAFDLSLEELKRITDVVCTVKKGTRLPDEFTYRFLK